MANYNLTQTGSEVQELLNKVSLFGKFACSDAADSQVKNIHIDDFTLIDGMAIAVTFVNGNSAASIQLKVNYTDNVPVYYRDSPLGNRLVTANATVILMYNATGNRWDVLSELCGTIGEAVYDISAAHPDGQGKPTPYADLAAALGTGGANIPEGLRKGGMSIKFIQGSVQSSDNKYVQFRCMAQNFTTDTTQWAIAEEGVYVENPEYVYVKTDAEGKILWAIRADGDIFYGVGVPSQVVNYINERIEELSLDEYDDIVAFLSNLIEGDKTLKQLLDEKLDAEGLDAGALKSVEVIENPEYIEVETDKDKRILSGRKIDGTKVENLPMEIQGVRQETIDNPEYIQVTTDSEGKVIEGTRIDGKKVFYGGIEGVSTQEEMDALREKVNSINPIYTHNAIVSFIDDDSGKYVPDIWGSIIQETGIRMGFACIAGYMSGLTAPEVYEQMPLSYLQNLYNSGHEVYSHSWTHPAFYDDSCTVEEVQVQCQKSRDWLNANGFTRNSDIIVYPGGLGETKIEKQDVVRRNYHYGVDTVGEGINPEPLNPLCIYRCNGDTMTLEELKEKADLAVSEKKLLVIMNHAYQLNRDKVNQMAKMTSFIQYLQENNVDIIPLEEAIHQIYGWN